MNNIKYHTIFTNPKSLVLLYHYITVLILLYYFITVLHFHFIPGILFPRLPFTGKECVQQDEFHNKA